MPPCCPPARGCNAQTADRPCALRIFMAAAASVPEAQLALERWDTFQRVARSGLGKAERRFRRRAYERARDRALSALAIEYAHRRPGGVRSRRGGPAVRGGGSRGRPAHAA